MTGRRGGLRNRATCRSSTTLAVLQLAITPFTSRSRAATRQADCGLQGTQDPQAAKGLFRGFVKADLQDPNPPGWVHVFLDDHPPPLTRVEQAEAFAKLTR